MTLRSFGTIALLVTSLLSVGCDKDNDDEDDNQYSAKMIALTAASWQFSSATAGGLNATDEIPECYRDNILEFEKDGTGTAEESAQVCDPSTEGPSPGRLRTTKVPLALRPLFSPGEAATSNWYL